MNVVFFCGDQSRYGVAHLKPLLASRFKISKVIIATQLRWDMFRQSLQGEQFYIEKKSIGLDVRSLVKAILSEKFINLIRKFIFKKSILDIKSICEQYNVPIEEVFDVNDVRFCQKLMEEEIELIISAAYPQIFSTNLLKIPQKGAMNFHPSALPSCRGAHPHYWAIAMGEKVGGVTAHFMTPKLDDGDIVAQIMFNISQYNYSEYYDRIEEVTPQLIIRVEKFFLDNESQPEPQKTEGKTYYRNNRQIHHRIFWNLHNAERIYNMCRAGSAYFFLKGERIVLKNSYITYNNRNMTNGVAVENGAVVDFAQDSVVVKVTEGFINIQEVEFNNRNFSWRKWADKFRIRIGMIME